MADIQLRFHYDMLVLSGPLSTSLEAQGFEMDGGVELLDLTEDEAVSEALRLQSLAGAQCLLTPSYNITEARLAHLRLEDHAAKIAESCLQMIDQFRPQHSIVEIGATGLPIDPGSKSSLMHNRDQYSQAVRLFQGGQVDAFLLNNLEGANDIRCALMGARRVSDAPLFASVDVDEQGNLVGRNTSIEEAIELMVEYEASVVGLQMSAEPARVCAVLQRAAQASSLPILLQLEVQPEESRLPKHTHNSAYWHPDTLLSLVGQFNAAGAQFLRAVGRATPTYTGALVAASSGMPCRR